jgi:hypothetical protein
VEEEHVMNHRKTNDLRWGSKKALQSSASGKSSVAMRSIRSNGAYQGEELRPKEDWKASISLDKRDSEKTTRTLHEDGTRD